MDPSEYHWNREHQVSPKGILLMAEQERPRHVAAIRVKKRLLIAGYEVWLKEEELPPAVP
jgi:hypothetical protein